MAKKLANTYYIIDDITLAGMWAPLEVSWALFCMMYLLIQFFSSINVYAYVC